MTVLARCYDYGNLSRSSVEEINLHSAAYAVVANAVIPAKIPKNFMIVQEAVEMQIC